MKFGPVPTLEAAGAILAHAVASDAPRIRKGTVLTEADVAELSAAGVAEVVVARLDSDDLVEDEAAHTVAEALRYHGIRAAPAATGRVNLHAEAAGVFTVDKALVDAVNAVDPAITLATLADFSTVQSGQMVATVKIIPFAVARATVDEVLARMAGRTAFALHPFASRRVGLVQSELTGTKASVLDKTARLLRDRLARSGSTLDHERRCAHHIAAMAAAIGDLASTSDIVIAFGASAVSDADDVIPAAIRAAGGRVERTGMPVDPGNLLVLGEIAGTPVIGAPGCARSPKPNGFDWILDRLMAGMTVEDADIAKLGVGGLLMEIPTRPQPREPVRAPSRLSAVLLAAGRSSRMGGPNKLLALFDGKPLVRRMAEAALAAGIPDVVVVTGHQSERVEAALSGLAVTVVHNADFAAGLSTSLKVGLSALPREAAGALVMLGDMPGLKGADIRQLVAAFEAAGGDHVVRATHQGKRGNPVILPRTLFPAVAALEGDVGARHLIEANDVPIVDVELGIAASLDVDTADAMVAAGGQLQG